MVRSRLSLVYYLENLCYSTTLLMADVFVANTWYTARSEMRLSFQSHAAVENSHGGTVPAGGFHFLSWKHKPFAQAAIPVTDEGSDGDACPTANGWLVAVRQALCY